MPKEEWGVKRICPTTGQRFYDMNKKPIVSPYTGETVTLDANTRTSVAVADKAEKTTDADQTEDDPILEDDDESSDELSIDGDLLDDDDESDDVSLEEIKDMPAKDED